MFSFRRSKRSVLLLQATYPASKAGNEGPEGYRQLVPERLGCAGRLRSCPRRCRRCLHPNRGQRLSAVANNDDSLHAGDAPSTITITFPTLLRPARAEIAAPPFSRGKREEINGLMAPVAQNSTSSRNSPAASAGLRVAKLPQNTPSTSQPLRSTKFSGILGMPAGNPTTR